MNENNIYNLDSNGKRVSETVAAGPDGLSVVVYHPRSGYPVGSYNPVRYYRG